MTRFLLLTYKLKFINIKMSLEWFSIFFSKQVISEMIGFV